jgi:hypothetical protein
MDPAGLNQAHPSRRAHGAFSSSPHQQTTLWRTMTTEAISALQVAVQPINQTLVDYEEYQKLAGKAWQLEHNALREAKEKEAAARAKWELPIVDAALRAIYFGHGTGSGAIDDSGAIDFLNFAAVIRENREAKKELEDLLFCMSSDEEEDARCAFGLGMLAGMMYAASTGITPPIPSLIEVKAILDAQNAVWEAMWKAEATPGAPQVA